MANGKKHDGDKHGGRELHEGGSPPGDSDPSEGCPSGGGSSESHVRPATDRRESVERYVAGVVVWCERAPKTGDEIEFPRTIEMALSDATVGYIFGSYEEGIPIDDLCDEGLRTQLDRIVKRLINLPSLEWWSEGFDPASYTWCEEVPGSSTTCIERPREVLVGSAGPAATSGAIERGLQAPVICEAAWFPSSETE